MRTKQGCIVDENYKERKRNIRKKDYKGRAGTIKGGTGRSGEGRD